MDEAVGTEGNAESGVCPLKNVPVESTNGSTLVFIGNEEDSNFSCDNAEEMHDPLSNGIENSMDSTSDVNPLSMETTPIESNEDSNVNSLISEENSCIESAVIDTANTETNSNVNDIVSKEGETEQGLGITIANVFTETSVNDNTKNGLACSPRLKKALLNTIDYPTKKFIKSIVKDAVMFTSPECLWLLTRLFPKGVEDGASNEATKTRIEQIISKTVTEDVKDKINDVLERVQDLTAVENFALFRRLKTRRVSEKSSPPSQEWNMSIMWIKTHLEVVPTANIGKSDVYQLYSSFFMKLSQLPLKCLEFTNLLQKIYPRVKETKRGGKGYKSCRFTNISMRTKLHHPKLPKFAKDQLHNNSLLSKYMACNDYCSTYESVPVEDVNKPAKHAPVLKIKLQIPKSKSTTTTSKSDIVVEDPLDLLHVAETLTVTEKVTNQVVEVVDLSSAEDSPVVVKQVAKKSVFPKRSKKVPAKFKEFTTMYGKSPSKSPRSSSDTKFNCDTVTLQTTNNYSVTSDAYVEQLLTMKTKLFQLDITKNEELCNYTISCSCCNNVFYVTEQHGKDLLSAKKKLEDFFNCRKSLLNSKVIPHPSIQNLCYENPNLILPNEVMDKDIDAQLSLRQFQVFDWYNHKISSLKRKLHRSSLNSSSTKTRNHYESKTINSSNCITNSSPKIVEPYPPIYISAVREPHKITEVYIKSEKTEAGASSSQKRANSGDLRTVEVPAQKKSKSSLSVQHVNPVQSRNRYTPYNRRKETDFIYFPTVDTSPVNLRIADLSTLYKCMLCLMLFNTEQKLFDHEQSHLYCHKCRRKLRDVELMRQHLIKHCERNSRKYKPRLKLYRVDSVAVMAKKYAEVFEMCNAYYNLKPKKKYREAVRLKVEPLPPSPVIEEVFINDIKPNIELLNKANFPIDNDSNSNTLLGLLMDVKPLTDLSNISDSLDVENSIYQESNRLPMFTSNPQPLATVKEPPLLIPLASTSTKKKKHKSSKHADTKRTFKIRVKDLIELS